MRPDVLQGQESGGNVLVTSKQILDAKFRLRVQGRFGDSGWRAMLRIPLLRL